jgi:acetyl-CoA synthetase (ADP-forming)
MAGAGGVLVEIVHDVALALAPLTRTSARALLERLQVWPLLAGARGRAPCDVDSLADALERLSWIAHVLGPRLVELDINPLLVQQCGVIALDARATR